MSTEQGPSRRYSKYWVWDYFSIKEDISICVCDICGTEKGLHKKTDDIEDMNTHLSDVHPRNYGIIAKKKNKDWKSLFERKECSTDTATSINIQCKLCDPNSNPYNMKLGIYVTRHMETHLENEHNVTESEWEILRNWRDMNLEDYYDLTEEQGSIKRTKSCKKCEDHEFQRSNLCIMLKHLIQYHDSEITFGLLPDKIRLPLDILPKGFNRNPSNDPVDPVDPVDPANPVDPVDPVNPVDPDVASSSNPKPSSSHRGPSSSGQSNPCKMRQETDSSMNIWQIKDAATTVNPHSPTSDLSDSSLRERASKRSKVSHNTSSDEDDK